LADARHRAADERSVSIPSIAEPMLSLDGARLEDSEGIPLTFAPAIPELGSSSGAAIRWFHAQAHTIKSLLSAHGALLFRGFAVADTTTFNDISTIFPTHRGGYLGGATPRSAIKGNVFEATRVPAPYKIQLHQEMSYLPHQPARLMFFCHVPPGEAGETILGDMRAISARIPSELRDAVRARKVRYVRNLASPTASAARGQWLADFHRSWKDCFGTGDRDAVDQACRHLDMSSAWCPDGSLELVHVSDGFRRHGPTGTDLWFNHIAVLHDNPRSLGPAHALHGLYRKMGHALPHVVTYGDGEPIPTAVVYELLDMLDKETIAFPWRQGDVMMLDNMLVAHGRNRFSGARDIQVTLHD
jgi:alpha-ketoglutarate-dependent taurine dioxygenase